MVILLEMNLQQFLQYKNNCPLCGYTLTTSFHSQKRQKIKFENNRFLVIFTMDALNKKNKSYQVGYSIGLDDNSFFMEFYSRDGEHFDKQIPISVLDRFKSFNSNLTNYKIYRHCTECENYNYSSNYFTLNFITCNIGDLSVISEVFGLIQEYYDNWKLYKLVNYYDTNKSILNYDRISKYEFLHQLMDKRLNLNRFNFANVIETNLIKFSSKDEIMERLGKLLIFV